MSAEVFQRSFGVSRETMQRLVIYENLLRKWQSKINLVSPSSLVHLWERHMGDSYQLLGLAGYTAENSAQNQTGTWLDLGSGAGFPGLVLAIAGFPGTVVLVESDQKKAAFMRTVIRETGCAARVLSERIETLSEQDIGPVRVVSARALAPLDKLMALCQPFFNPGTLALFPKGRDWAAEIEACNRHWVFQYEALPSQTDPTARILKFTQISPRALENV